MSHYKKHGPGFGVPLIILAAIVLVVLSLAFPPA